MKAIQIFDDVVFTDRDAIEVLEEVQIKAKGQPPQFHLALQMAIEALKENQITKHCKYITPCGICRAKTDSDPMGVVHYCKKEETT